MKKPSRTYITVKYVQANSVVDALRKEKKQHVDDVRLERRVKKLEDAIGFDITPRDDDEEEAEV